MPNTEKEQVSSNEVTKEQTTPKTESKMNNFKKFGLIAGLVFLGIIGITVVLTYNSQPENPLLELETQLAESKSSQAEYEKQVDVYSTKVSAEISRQEAIKQDINAYKIQND